MTAPRWPVVLFDLDGTLADTIGLIVASYQHALASVLGQTRTEEQIRGWIGQPLLRTFEEASLAHAALLDRVYREWNLANHDALIRPYAGVPSLLRDLTEAGARTGVVTSKRRSTAEKTMGAVGLTGLVDLVGGMDDTDRHKPDPAPLLAALGVLGAAPGTAVYVGDAVVDVQAARAAGMDVVAVTWGAGARPALEAAGPGALVDTVADLRRVLLPGAA